MKWSVLWEWEFPDDWSHEDVKLWMKDWETELIIQNEQENNGLAVKFKGVKRL